MKKQQLLKKLSKHDLITFDVFDTAITRLVLEPTDIFKLVEAKLDKKYNINSSFARKRIRAEKYAILKIGESYNLEDIYSYMDSIYKEALDLELETELEMCIPRRDILDIFNELVKQDKKIVFVSDMYLSSSFIKEMLIKCGYVGDYEVIVSNEQKASKAGGKLWEKFFNKYNDIKTIHVGDSEISDCKNLEVINKDHVLIKSGRSKYETSNMYAYLNGFHDKNPHNLILLGTFINDVCFNSPFEDSKDVSELKDGIWLGPTFTAFMNFLYKNKDDSVLLFVTREGFLLQDYYKTYCDTLGVKPQDNTLFYTSRRASSGASVISYKDLRDTMDGYYHGTVEQFLKSRLNCKLPLDKEKANINITLPTDRTILLDALKGFEEDIYNNGKRQNKAYKQYFKDIAKKFKKDDFTIADIGYSGTAQFFLSKVLGKNISGEYMFTTPKPIPNKLDCGIKTIARNVVIGGGA